MSINNGTGRNGAAGVVNLGRTKPAAIGLFGFGCVGQGFYELATRLSDAPFRIKRIGVKHREKKRPIGSANFSYDPIEILYDPEIDLIVEVIDDSKEAFQIVSAALLLGKKVVTANKKLLGERLPELLELERNYGGTLLYEAAACGNIPIIRTLETWYHDIPIRSVEGIVNGSSNYILSRMRGENISYQTALWLAQDRGFAESDPTLDVKGLDARSKLSILARHAFGEPLPLEEIVTLGIDNIEEQDLRFAAERGYRVKLVASLRKVGGKVIGSVLPGLRPATDPLYNVEDENNSVVVETEFGIRQQYFGKGAGSHPTGEAVLVDVLESLKGYRYTKRPISREVGPGNRVDDHGNTDTGYDRSGTYYVRVDSPSDLERIPFDEVIEQYSSRRFTYGIGTIGARALAEHPAQYDGSFFIASMPSEVAEGIALAA